MYAPLYKHRNILECTHPYINIGIYSMYVPLHKHRNTMYVPFYKHRNIMYVRILI